MLSSDKSCLTKLQLLSKEADFMFTDDTQVDDIGPLGPLLIDILLPGAY